MPTIEELPCGCAVFPPENKKVEYCTRHLLYDLCAELILLQQKHPDASGKNPLLEELIRRGFDRSAHLR